MQSVRLRVFQIVEKAEKGDRASLIFDIGILVLIVINVLAVMLETVQSIATPWRAWFDWLEFVSVAIFTMEYLARLWAVVEAPGYGHWFWGRFEHARSFMAIVDLLAIMPFYLPMFMPVDLRFLRALRLLRLFRIFKVGRYTEAMSILTRVIDNTKEEVGVTLFVAGVLLVVSASLMYFIEQDAQPEVFSSIPAALWWAVATLTTVGYGDVYPVTVLGKILSGGIAIVSIGMIALPAGILGSGFVEEMTRAREAKRAKSKGRARCPHCHKVI